MQFIEKVKDSKPMQFFDKKKNEIGVMTQTAMISASCMLMSFADDAPGGGGGGSSSITNKITKLFNGVYGQITQVITALAAVLMVSAIIVILVSKDEKKGASAISWIKRIVICWFAIVSIGAIISWISGIIGPAGSLTS